jgi:hypothetical protein
MTLLTLDNLPNLRDNSKESVSIYCGGKGGNQWKMTNIPMKGGLSCIITDETIYHAEWDGSTHALKNGSIFPVGDLQQCFLRKNVLEHT